MALLPFVYSILGPVALDHEGHCPVVGSFRTPKGVEKVSIEIDTDSAEGTKGTKGTTKTKCLAWIWPQIKSAEVPRTNVWVVYFHGNAGNLGWYSKHIERWARYFNVIAVDYPGYGISEGVASATNTLRCAEKVGDVALELAGNNPNRIVIVGFSLGSAAASHLASVMEKEKKTPVAAVVLEAGFPRMSRAAGHMMPLLQPLTPFLPGVYANEKKLSELDETNVIMVHAPEDKVTPYADMLRLFSVIRRRHPDREGDEFFDSFDDVHAGFHSDVRVWTAVLEVVLAKK